jgi:hypothetical protein
MAQKQISVTATNGSAVVTLSDTSGIVVGSYFKRSDENTPGSYPSVYEVASIVADTSVTLTGNYAGTSGTFTGLFTNDFTANLSLPLLNSGDLGTPEILSRALNILDSAVYNGAAASFTSVTVGDINIANGTTSHFTNTASNADNRFIDFDFDTISTASGTVRINRATDTSGDADVIFYGADGTSSPKHTFDKNGNYTLEGAQTFNSNAAVYVSDGGTDDYTQLKFDFPDITSANIGELTLFRNTDGSANSSLSIKTADNTNTNQHILRARGDVDFNQSTGNANFGGDVNVTGSINASGTANEIHIDNTDSGATSVSQSTPGVFLTAGGMNVTSKYTPGLKFGSTDTSFTTTNPKFLAGILGYATQAYSVDTASGMGLAFFTTPDTSGATPSPVEVMTLDQDGNVSAAGEIKGQQLAGLERSSNPSDPSEGEFVIWMSDGTGSGDDGDIMIKVTAGPTTKTATLLDFSAA